MIDCGGRGFPRARCFLTARQQFAGDLQVFKIHKEMPRNPTKMITIAEVRPNAPVRRGRWKRFVPSPAVGQVLVDPERSGQITSPVCRGEKEAENG